MPTLYPNTSMTVREASNNINRSIVEEDYCHAEEIDEGVVFEWDTENAWLFSDTYCSNDNR